MDTVGSVLRTAREKKRLTVDDLQNRTKIRRKYIEAIENDHYDVVPGEVYLKGFIRAIAEEVGVAQEEAVNLYEIAVRPPLPEVTDRRGRPVKKAQAPAPKEAVVPVPMPPMFEEKVVSRPLASEPVPEKPHERRERHPVHIPKIALISGGIILAAVVIGVLALVFWPRGAVVPPPTPPSTTLPGTPSAEPPAEPPATPPANTEPPATPPAAVQPTLTLASQSGNDWNYEVAGGQGLSLVVAVRDRCWMQVSADGVDVTNYGVTLPAGGTRTFTAKTKINARFGNSRAVGLVINNLPVPAMNINDPANVNFTLKTTP